MRPRFEHGAAVRLKRNVRNDGTFPGEPTGALLVRRGSVGYVRDVGTFLQDQLIYSVHFLESGRMVGCREEELQDAAEPWNPSRFEFRDRVAARLRLASGGRVLVERGEVGEVMRVVPGPESSFAYHVLFPARNLLQVPETALDPAAPPPSPSEEAR